MKRLLLLLGLLATPVAAQEVSLPHTIFTLPNGLTVIVHEDHSTPIAAVNLWYHVGSGYEVPGRTGFAHLFEHIMFEGSGNVPRGQFDILLESVGALINGTTNSDRTNYFEVVPSNAVELALWLEADRMGNLLETMGQEKLDIQRDVVKNERRQSYENRPYGMFFETAAEALYPTGHPYSWSTIGSMDDLSAATLDDVESFFRRYYAPNNASLVVAGAVDTEEIRRYVERFFGWIPRGAEVVQPDLPLPAITATRHITLEERATLPQVNLMWRTPPLFAADDAGLDVLARILGSGRNSRLYRRLVYEEQVAQDVTVYNSSRLLSGDMYVRVTGREGIDLDDLERAVLEEVRRLASEGPEPEEVERVVNGLVTASVRSLEQALGKADQLNSYFYYTGEPDYAAEDLGRYQALTVGDVQRVAGEYLDGMERVVISIVPEGARELAAEGRADR